MGVPHKLVFVVLMLTLGSQVRTGEIYGGHEAVPHSRPYMVLLECWHRNNTAKWKAHCDGFLLNEDYVMTAAHCEASWYVAFLGLHNYHKGPKQRITAEESFPHKGYNKTNQIYKNDIMLIKLSTKAHFTPHVKTIALAEAGDGNLSLPQNCLLSGWGCSDNSDGYSSEILMEVNVTLVDHCYSTEDHLYCSEGESGPGKGDSGGPLVCEDGRAYGVVSFIRPKPRPKLYAYTIVSHFKDWIDGVMNGTVTKST